ncbi:MAG: hypothetical protein ACRYGK_17125 [Janthinobacterium lividum]
MSYMVARGTPARPAQAPGQEESFHTSSSSETASANPTPGKPLVHQRKAHDHGDEPQAGQRGATHESRGTPHHAESLLASQETTPQKKPEDRSRDEASSSSRPGTPVTKKSSFSITPGSIRLRWPFATRDAADSSTASSSGTPSPGVPSAARARVQRPPRWRQNLGQLRHELCDQNDFAMVREQVGRHGVHLPLWRQAMGRACAPLVARMLEAIRQRIATLGKKEAAALIGMGKAPTQQFVEKLALPACAGFLPEYISGKHWQELTEELWTRTMSMTVLQAVPVEARIMLGEFIDEFRASEAYQRATRNIAQKGIKSHLDRQIIQTFIMGLEEGALAAASLPLPNDDSTSSAYSLSRFSLRASQPAPAPDNGDAARIYREVLVFLQQATDKDSEVAKMAALKHSCLRVQNFFAVLLGDAYTQARERSCYKVPVEIDGDARKAADLEKTIRRKVLPWLEGGPPGSMTASTSDGTNTSELQEGNWCGMAYPSFLYHEFVNNFDAIRIWAAYPGRPKDEINSIEQFIAYALPEHLPGAPYTQQEQKLLFCVSYLANENIELYVRAAYFTARFPLKTEDRRTIYPEMGALQCLFHLSRVGNELKMRFTLRSDDVRAVTVVADPERKIFTEASSKPASNATFKFSGCAWFGSEGFKEFDKPTINSLNLNLLVSQGTQSQAGLFLESTENSSGGRFLVRKYSHNHSHNRPSPSSSEAKSRHSKSLSKKDPETPTKLKGGPL